MNKINSEIVKKRYMLNNELKYIGLIMNNINNDVVFNVFNNIIKTIENNVEINKYCLYSIYDFIESESIESESFFINNIVFVNKIKSKISFYIIDLNNIENSFKEFINKLNDYIIECLIIDDNIDLIDYGLDLNDVFNKIMNGEIDYMDYISYLDNCLLFWKSFKDCLLDFINKYDLYFN